MKQARSLEKKLNASSCQPNYPGIHWDRLFLTKNDFLTPGGHFVENSQSDLKHEIALILVKNCSVKVPSFTFSNLLEDLDALNTFVIMILTHTEAL